MLLVYGVSTDATLPNADFRSSMDSLSSTIGRGIRLSENLGDFLDKRQEACRNKRLYAGIGFVLGELVR
jgi:hypothetical protein